LAAAAWYRPALLPALARAICARNSVQ
jgi:hypothetical protein